MSSGRFIKGGLSGGVESSDLPPQSGQQYYQPNKEEGWLPKAGRNIATNIIKGIEYPLGVVGSLQKSVQGITGVKSPVSLPTVEDVQGYVEPKLEKVLSEA